MRRQIPPHVTRQNPPPNQARPRLNYRGRCLAICPSGASEGLIVDRPKSSAALSLAKSSAWPPSHRQRTRWRATGAVPAEPTWSGRRVACPAAGRHQQPPRHGGWRSEKLLRLGRLSISVRQVPRRRRPMYSMHRVVRPYQHPPGLTQWKQRANVPRRINPQMTRGMPSGVVPLANFRTVEAAAR